MNVTLITKNPVNALIEYDTDNGKRRSIVPIETLVYTNEGYTHIDPTQGVPHGVDWSLFSGKLISISAIDRAFRDIGIFTPEDLKYKSDSARTIILGLLGVSINDLRKFGVDQMKGT